MGLGILAIFIGLLCQIAESRFKLSSINLDDNTFQACTYCDERSDRASSRATAYALREFMTRNHVKITVDKGDVELVQRFPNSRIDTGHSCSKTAEARDVVATVLMIPGTVELEGNEVLYIDEIKNSIAVASVEHALTVDMSVRVRFGTKIFGKCHRVGRKTCSTNGESIGTNKISVNLAASNTLVECIGGRQHLTFKIDAKVVNEAVVKSYGPVEVGKKGGCDIKILGFKVGSINSKIQEYATRYLKASNRFHELRGSKLVAELERKLGARLGSTITLPINDANGKPRSCESSGRRKRSTSCVRKTCPDGFTRLGDTDTCQKYFGRQRPNCAKYGATLYTRRVGSSLVLYWCHKAMSTGSASQGNQSSNGGVTRPPHFISRPGGSHGGAILL